MYTYVRTLETDYHLIQFAAQTAILSDCEHSQNVCCALLCLTSSLGVLLLHNLHMGLEELRSATRGPPYTECVFLLIRIDPCCDSVELQMCVVHPPDDLVPLTTAPHL